MKKIPQMLFIETPDEPSFAELFSDTMIELEATDYKLLTSTSAFVIYETEIDEPEITTSKWHCADCDVFYEHGRRCPYNDRKYEPRHCACKYFKNERAGVN